MRNKILVVGGYGEVGKHVVRTLLTLGHEVVIGGRNAAKALVFFGELQRDMKVGPKASFRKVDVAEISETANELFEDIRGVILCTDQKGTAFTEACIQAGVIYLDISADGDYLNAIEKLQSTAVESGATAVLSVGLAPGLTNLLARKVADHSDQIDRVEIGVLLGAGDSHGIQAIDWTLRNTLEPKTGSEVATIDYGAGWGRRWSHAFDFADQHAVARTLNLKAKTFLALSSRYLTMSLFSLRLPILKQIARVFYGALLSIFSVKLGWDTRYAISVSGFSRDSKTPVANFKLTGETEALVTGVTAASMLHHLLKASPKTPPKAGVFHSHEVLQISDILPDLSEYAGVQV